MGTEAAAGDLEYGAVAGASLNSKRRPAGACRAKQVAVRYLPLVAYVRGSFRVAATRPTPACAGGWSAGCAAGACWCARRYAAPCRGCCQRRASTRPAARHDSTSRPCRSCGGRRRCGSSVSSSDQSLIGHGLRSVGRATAAGSGAASFTRLGEIVSAGAACAGFLPLCRAYCPNPPRPPASPPAPPGS